MASIQSKASRVFDIIVYGATGFTGKRVVKHLVASHPELKVAICGRSLDKLNDLASETNISTDQIFVAPVTDQSLLQNTLSKARIVLSCSGPYRHVGKEIVQAAIAAQTDYLDLCGEPQFFDDMLAEYDQQAQSNNTLVISACAFDCVPAELLFQLARRELTSRYDNTPVTNMEIIHTIQNVSRGNATTYHAAVDGFHASITGELKASRKKVSESLKLPAAPKRPTEWPRIVQPPTTPVHHPETDTYLLKFMGADAACILASDRYLRYRSNAGQGLNSNPPPPSQLPHPYMNVCFGVPTQKGAFQFIAYGAVFSTLARFKWGCKMLHNNPDFFSNGLFTEGGPTEEEMSKVTFKTHCTAYGMTKDQVVKVSCQGPEPGYVATPRMMVALAMTVLRHRESLPFSSGVMLPGAAFGASKEVYDNLATEDIVFEVVTNNDNENSEVADQSNKV